MPGVSIIFPPKGRSNISAKVVVCKPLPLHPLTSCVLSSNCGQIIFMNEDLPTPLCPLNNDILFLKDLVQFQFPFLFQRLPERFYKPISSYICFHSKKFFIFLFLVQVSFIKNNCCRHMIHFTGN